MPTCKDSIVSGTQTNKQTTHTHTHDYTDINSIQMRKGLHSQRMNSQMHFSGARCCLDVFGIKSFRLVTRQRHELPVLLDDGQHARIAVGLRAYQSICS